mgnify:FL=1
MYNNQFGQYGQYGGYMPSQATYSGFMPQQGSYTPTSPFVPQAPNYAPQAQQAQATPQQGQVNTNKIYVTGIDDARARQLPPNSDFIFLDNDKPLLYRKTVDATGKMEIKAFKISEYTETEAAPAAAPAVDLSQFVSMEEFKGVQAEMGRIKRTIDSLLKKEKKGAEDNG